VTTTSVLASAVNLNSPGKYLHWSIFNVSVANLALIAVMVVIFGLALIVPFPGHRKAAEGDPVSGSPPSTRLEDTGDPADADMWTARIRRTALRLLPPGKLLPDRQPAYVSSWIYVFGVAALAALGLAIISGFTIAIGGTDWWHTNSVGHFFNSLHLWSVQLFMAFIVIHLWGKFWMAAWRGRRALTWITGVVAFAAAVLECFTGYLSQQNFDSQWIATNGKDAINTTGLGGFFNLLNFGQMLLWHVVLIPILLVALVGAHVLLVRVRGVSHPLPARRLRGRAARRTARAGDSTEWRGPTRRYDIVKEAAVATAISLALVTVLAAVVSSPDEPPASIATWAKVAPADFLATAASELGGTSETATYGPPYNNGSSNVQRLGWSWQTLAGVHIPVNPAQAFVLAPLSKLAPTDPALTAALAQFNNATPAQQAAWTNAYLDGVTKVSFKDGNPVIPAGEYGPVPTLMNSALTLARSGALDTDLLADRTFYGTDFTKPLLFLEDGQYYSGLAQAQNLTGSQWGVMNETGSYPGQPWLWLYTLWYQMPGLKNSANIDLIAIYLTGLGTLLLLLLPFIPGLRNIPEVVPIHRLVWRDWNGRANKGAEPESGPGSEPPSEVGTELEPSQS
jgi:hypothetical protein